MIRQPRVRVFATILALLIILLMGAWFRTLNLANWDERQGLHPDERFVVYAVDGLRLPHSLRGYFDSSIAPLNPRNHDWSKMWVYGTLPTTVTRLVATAIDRVDAASLYVVGRGLSTFFDLLACLALFFLARRLGGLRVGLLATALYACAVMPIQQSHFFTTDNFATAFTTFALLSIVRLFEDGRWRHAALAGIWTGAAVASKINLVALCAIIGVGILFWLLLQGPFQRRRIVRAALLLGLAGIATFVSFRLLQPDAFTGPYIWNIKPDPRFLDNLRQVRGLVDGTVDMPPSDQWASRTPYLYPLMNMVVWGMGLPLGIAAWLGFIFVGLSFILRWMRRRSSNLNPGLLILWTWVALYWAWQGGGFNPSLRYFLSIYPPLILFAALLVVQAGSWFERSMRRMRWKAAGQAALPALVLLVCTWSWAWAFTRIYTRPHSRIAAAHWMLDNLPHGASYTWEIWDDALPYTNGNGNNCNPFCLIETAPYAEDEPSKFFGQPTAAGQAPIPGQDPQDGLLGEIGRADYIVLSSSRVYGSVARLPHRYPATLRYYRALFDGSLGYDLIGDFHSFPSLFGLPIPDLSAEEQFTVYDHPRVLIFRRTERYNPDTARMIITGGVNWSEVYKISAKTTSAAPTAFRLTADSWQRLRNTGGALAFPLISKTSSTFGQIVTIGRTGFDIVLWLLALEVLGFAALGIIWFFRIPLPDRGLLSSRFVGLLVWGGIAALLAGSGRVNMGRTLLSVWYGVFVGFGLRLLWMERDRLRLALQAYRRDIWSGYLLYGGILLIGLAMRLFLPVVGTNPGMFGPAQWAALVRSPVLPPPDPFFAGGRLVLPYLAFAPAAMLVRFTGIAASVGYHLVLATLLATLAMLVAVLLWRPRRLAVPLVGACMILAPGLIEGPFRPYTPLGALLGGSLGTLATAVLVAGLFVVVRGFMPSRSPRQWLLDRRSIVLLLILGGGIFALLFGQERWVAYAMLLPSAVLLFRGRDRLGVWRVVAFVAAVVLLGSGGLLLVPFFGNLGLTGLTQPVDFSPLGVTIGLTMVLLVVAAYVLVLQVRTVGRWVALLTGIGIVGWFAAGILLHWPPIISLLPIGLLLCSMLIDMVTAPRLRNRRAVQVLMVVVGALLLLCIAARSLRGLGSGDPATLFCTVIVLLVCAAGWGLSDIVRRPWQRRLPLFIVFVTLLLLVISLGQAIPSAMRETAAQLAPSAGATDAINALLADEHGMGVIALAPSAPIPAVLTATGSQSLISAPDAESMIRSILRPSVDTVIDGRQRALGDIFGADATRTQAALASYAVDYVWVGPDEQATYGATTGDGLRDLANRGAVKELVNSGDVTLYRTTTPDGIPPYVAQSARLPVPPVTSDRLERPLAELPIVNEYAWNRLANQHQWLAILLWLVVVEIIGLLALPLCMRVFRSSVDRGWAWSKLLGLLVWGYGVWLPVSLGWWSYRWSALVISALGLAVMSLMALQQRKSRGARIYDLDNPSGRLLFSIRWRDVIRTEALFLVTFGIWALVRAGNPDLWHPWLGGEKPFEFGMLNAIVRSPIMPPPDPFFSGLALNYYYYGLFLISLPIRATGIDPAIAFNLAVPLLFALVAIGAANVVRELTGRWRWALLGVVMVLLIGPVGSAFPVGQSRGLGVAVRAVSGGLHGFGGRLGDWFWGPSRIIPHTINEFPFFSYLFADLHAHMIALPITILAIALAIELGRSGTLRRRVPLLLVTSLVLGTLAVTNSWDAPTYGLVIGGALVGRTWRKRFGRIDARRLIGSILLMMGLATLLLIGGLLFYLPFFLHFKASVGGIGRVKTPDPPILWTALYGAALYVMVTFLASLAWIIGRRTGQPIVRQVMRGGALTVPLVVVVVMLISAGGLLGPAPIAGLQSLPLLPLVLALLLVMGLGLAVFARLRDEEWLTLWLFVAGLLVALAIQFVYIRDFLDGGDDARMNTVFKFGFQIWTLTMLGAAAAVPLIIRLLRRLSENLLVAWSVGLLALLLAGATYPVIGIPSRESLRFDEHPGLTLNGMEYMQTARYSQDDQQLNLHWDAEAIQWMNLHLPGMPIVLQSEREFYRAYGVRIAASTGLPTVLGRLHADEQHPGPDVYVREEDVKQIYSTPDPTIALQLLSKYHVDYVYVGRAETVFYDAAGLAKWETMVGSILDVAYQNPGAKLYKVRQGITSVPPLLPKPVTTVDPQLQALEADNAARPGDASTAFGLATQYVQQGKIENAVAVLSAAAPSNPQDIALHQFLGDLLAQLGRGDEAVAAWTAAMNANPTSGNIAKLGTGLTQLGRYDEAEKLLRQALQLAPQDAVLHYYLGDLALKRNATGDVELARQELQAYLATAPADSPYRGTAEQALQKLGQ